MKKFNLFKKIGISALSLIIAGSIGGACFTSTNANASYDYSVTPKSDEYVAGIFDKSDNVSVKAGYNAPDYMNIEAKYSKNHMFEIRSNKELSKQTDINISAFLFFNPPNSSDMSLIIRKRCI